MRSNGLAGYFLLTGVLFALRIALGLLEFPAAAAPFLDVLSVVAFVGLPVLAVFWAGSHPWTRTHAVAFIVGGIVLQGGALLLARTPLGEGVLGLIVQSFGQFGLVAWCTGLGALVASLIKERNLLLPVALFLAGLDVFFVFHPSGPVAKVMSQNPEILSSVALEVPMAREAAPGRAPKEPKIEPFAYVGPADVFFSAMFFVALYRFEMRARETARWLVVALVGYLILVMLPIGLGMLPALVPIGLTVILVNRGEFRLAPQEKAMTAFVGAIAVFLAGFGVWSRLTKPPALPVGPAQTGTGQRPPAPGD
ncbi:MAG: hypothetical protein IT207_06495 [Fimbriimonadaceae bacterium]|nr:hypothetical protein [Fimbriimonadaceae bacterium]